jgi:NAD(P)-dependent dehydrogenase (short-subunit alcohol dehydrogenase family)
LVDLPTAPQIIHGHHHVETLQVLESFAGAQGASFSDPFIKRWVGKHLLQRPATGESLINLAPKGSFRESGRSTFHLPSQFLVSLRGGFLGRELRVIQIKDQQALFPVECPPGTAVVNISSLVARTGGAGEWVHYAASKGAVNSFTIGLAREVASEGIRVNAVSPGLIETELHVRNGDPGRIDRMSPTIPMQRGGRPEEIAAGVLWLFSPEASYTAGAILEIGGGR